MAEMIPTFGGRPTRGETYSKLIHHIDEARNLMLVMSHLLNTEDDIKSKSLARGWALIEEMQSQVRQRLVMMAQGHIQ